MEDSNTIIARGKGEDPIEIPIILGSPVYGSYLSLPPYTLSTALGVVFPLTFGGAVSSHYWGQAYGWGNYNITKVIVKAKLQPVYAKLSLGHRSYYPANRTFVLYVSIDL